MNIDKLKEFGITPKENTQEEIAVYSLTFCYSLVEKEIENYLKQYGLSPAKFNTLLVIKHQGSEEGISQVEIGKKLIVTASNTTKLLDRMGKEGLVERHPQKNDRRVNLIKITDKGSEILEQAWPGYVETVKRLTGVIKREELSQVTDILTKWFDLLNK